MFQPRRLGWRLRPALREKWKPPDVMSAANDIPISLTLAAETLKMATCGKAPFEFTRQLGQRVGPERVTEVSLLEQRAKRGVAAAEERSGRDSECVACLRDALSRPLLALCRRLLGLAA